MIHGVLILLISQFAYMLFAVRCKARCTLLVAVCMYSVLNWEPLPSPPCACAFHTTLSQSTRPYNVAWRSVINY